MPKLSHILAADTNVLLDYAQEAETVHDCFAILKKRLAKPTVIILPTVIAT